MTPIESPPEPVNFQTGPVVPIEELVPAAVVTEDADAGTVQLRIVHDGDQPEESAKNEAADGPVRIELTSAGHGKRRGRLRSSFEALGAIRSSRDAADWLEAASALKADAIRLRNSSAARHSAVLLATADALTFTDPEDPNLDPTAFESLERALAILGEPFIAERSEEDFLVGLIRSGWNLAPAVDIDLAKT